MSNRKCRNFWNKETCSVVAAMCNTRSEFKYDSPSAYTYARKNGFLNEICIHMLKRGNKVRRCIYSYEFSDNHVYVGLTYDIEKRKIQRLNNDKDSVSKHIAETNLIPTITQLSDYIDVDNASILEGAFLEKYRNDGWLLLNKVKTGSIGGDTLVWTYDMCKTEALKYNSRNDFRRLGKGAYGSSISHGWHNEICSHMKRPQRKIIWTFDKCRTEALKYETKKDFSSKSNTAYQTSIRNKWINLISTHMRKLPFNKKYWTKERCMKIAMQCKTKTEFCRKNGSAYVSSTKNKWINEFFDY